MPFTSQTSKQNQVQIFCEQENCSQKYRNNVSCMYVYIVLKDFFIYGIRVVFLCFWNTHNDGIIKQFVILINFIMQI